MKKTLLVGLAIGMVSMVATAAFALESGNGTSKPLPAQGYTGAKNSGGSGIVGTSHDLSGNGTSASFITTDTDKDAQSRICVFCHHPHNTKKAADMAGGYSPLWNREMSTRTFAAYNNGGFENTTGTPHALNAIMADTGLSGVSLLCMSCHDGAVAMNAYSVTTGSSRDNAPTILDSYGKNQITNDGSGRGAAFLSDMSNHHPMGFDYRAVQRIDNEIAPVTTVMVPAGITQAGGDPAATGTTIADLLDGTNGSGYMECVTCHDVHNTQNAKGAERFLWRSNNKSNFCLTCHLK
jgi:hypothetical protein